MEIYSAILWWCFINALVLKVVAQPHKAAGGGGGSGGGHGGLQVGYYAYKCPTAELIVKETVERAFSRNAGLAAGLIRLHAHDCFVNGCDASILLDYTPTGEKTEKLSLANVGLKGLEVVDEAKMELENQCPETVSCADIMAFAARDAVAMLGLEKYEVPSGRRDGNASLAQATVGSIPLPNMNAAQMTQVATSKGLSQEELVVLLGAHSIGQVHCAVISNDIYNFKNTHKPDPTLNPAYAADLRRICPLVEKKGAEEAVAPLNPEEEGGGGGRLSNAYYVNLLQGKAALASDRALLRDVATAATVTEMAEDAAAWEKKFTAAMVKMGVIGVVTGEEGEIRSACRVVNS